MHQSRYSFSNNNGVHWMSITKNNIKKHFTAFGRQSPYFTHLLNRGASVQLLHIETRYRNNNRNNNVTVIICKRGAA